jgi:hypothetical protein
MFRRPLYLLIAVFAAVSLACGITVNIPVDQVTAGPTMTDSIKIAEPDAQQADVTLSFGAGKLSLAPGADGALITGEATYNVQDFKPKVEINGSEIRLETGNLQLNGVPHFDQNLKNDWNLKFSAMPMKLSISAGAYEGDYEFGGLALQSLEIMDGAANVQAKFSEPNRTVMDVLRYITGASNVKLSGLANANFRSMTFRSGAGDYTLDFSGKLQNDAVVTVESGISRVILIVPDGVSAKVVFKGGLANVKMSGSWEKSGDGYELKGSGYKLIITVEMGAGDLELRTSQ